MMLRSNMHTHTPYCDGKSCIEDVVKAAIEKGMTSLGFSGHAYTPFDTSYCMLETDTEAYRAEIEHLKEKYCDKIKLFCGLEMDYFSVAHTDSFDYVIGSVHYVEKQGIYYDVDMGEEAFIKNVERGWNGDVYAFIEDYFSLVSDVVRKTNADIIGHFDLVTKYNEGERLFSQSHPRYIKAWQSAVDALLPAGKPFEINTGAMQRGYRSVPYPAVPILKRIKERGGKVMINSDCHQADAINFGFEDAACIAKECGFASVLQFDGRDTYTEVFI